MMLFVVTAFDGDEPETDRSRVTFDLPLGTPFDIHPSTGVMTVTGALMVQRYEVEVTVRDHGSPSLNSTAVFYVQVVPSNIYAPMFQPPFEFSFSENDDPDMPVFVFNVTDMDTGEEGTVNLTLLPTDFSANFSLEFSHSASATYGNLFLLDAFDRENIQNFTLVINATDIGHEMFRQMSSQDFYVTISDENDNFPEFIDAPYEIRIGEDASGSIIQVSASDEDISTNAELVFSLADGSDFNNTFEIDDSSGNVSVIGTLRKATTPFYQLTVIVSDRGTPTVLSTNTTINITVIEVNDNQPQFSPDIPNNRTIPEDTSPGFELVNITVSDADTEEAGAVNLMLEQTGAVFRLDGNTLVLNQTVDFEVGSL